ncbi:alpha/beta hydrolase fold domain-containing protein [Streptomyces sp. NPDC096132]|uniref:flavin-containing monooxygenase n=1 Tax=Streptomyces sp. NPDC096132 TaxID=3366075 RepID=UPI00382B76D0
MDHDVVVLGAGFAGLYAVHKFRDELGLSVQAFDAAEGVGGTWYWNRYPGARCDIESIYYSYSFSDEIQREWQWSEKYAGQPEILAYLEWATDRLDLRRSIQFGTRITSLTWDESAARWIVSADDGTTHSARFVISGVGPLSHAKDPEFKGLDTFQGELYRTSDWPHEPVDLAGKRVAVIGTGSSGIQVVQTIADQVGRLTVFQRTPNYATPLRNKPYDENQRAWNCENWEQLRSGSRESPAGLPYEGSGKPALVVDPDERRRVFDQAYYEDGGFHMLATFVDLMYDERANDTVSDYIREQIKARVKDPVKAELLSPKDHPYATKRPPMETEYYEAFNLPHVDLVDVRTAPIVELTETGLRTTQASYEFDVIILAIGFDAYTGAVTAIPTTGRDGLTIQDAWANGPRNYLGVSTAGFPNFFNIAGPLNVTGQFPTPLVIEEQVDYAAGAVRTVLAAGANSVEATPEAEQTWIDTVNGVFDLSLWAKTEKSWYRGGNIEGKANTAYFFTAGGPFYLALLAQSAHSGFGGLAFDDKPVDLPPLARLDPAAALTVAMMMNSGAKPVEQISIEEFRAVYEQTAFLQPPGPDLRVEDLADPRVRVYVPSEEQSLPVVLYFHGGGWAAGSADAGDPLCRSTAARLGAVVVSVDYRLAPEHPFPAAPEDALSALHWTREHIAEYGGDPERIALLGDSAGGNLAAVTALQARDEGIPLVAQALVYPAVDPESDTPSQKEFAEGPFLSTAAGKKFWQIYLAGAPVTPLAAPARASLAGVTPALVVTAELDPLRDEGEQYAGTLAAAGVAVEQHRVPGLFHGSFTMGAGIPRAQEMHDLVAQFLTARFDRTTARA